MDYENFKEELIEGLKENFEARGIERMSFRDQGQVNKLNGGYDGVVVTPQDSAIGVTVIMTKLYEAHENGAPLGEIIDKAAESRMAEIAVIRTHITTYSKTKDVYAQYKKVGFSRKFFEAHREEITIHKAAKNAFEKMDKIPKMKELNAEYGELLSLKKRLYAEYRQARKEMKDYQTAKFDIDRILNLSTEEQQKEKEAHGAVL